MTREEVKAKQDEIVASGFNLGHWYGTGCEKCCGVYPKFCTGTYPNDVCWYECEVCGKRTEAVTMPWIAKEKWNAGEFLEEQIRMF